MITPLAQSLGFQGPLDGDRTLTIINAYSAAFFEHVFRGQNSPIFEGPSTEFPEVDHGLP